MNEEIVTIKVHSSTRGLLKYLSAVKQTDMIWVAHDLVQAEFRKQQKMAERYVSKGLPIPLKKFQKQTPNTKTK